MIEPKRRFARGVFLLAAADLAGRSILFILSPVMTRLLTPAQYGSYALLLSIGSVLMLVQYAGMDSAYPFFRANDRGENDRRILVTASVVSSAAILSVMSLVAIIGIGTGWLARFTGLGSVEVLLFMAGLIPAALSSWYLYLLRYRHETTSFVRVNLIGQIGGPLLAIPIMMRFPQDRRMAVFFAVLLSCHLLAFIWALREFALQGVRVYDRAAFSSALGREMLRYGVRLVPAFVLYALCAHSGRFLLGWFSGPDAVSILALSATLTSAALVVRAWFSFFWDPHMAEWIARESAETYVGRLQVAVPLIATMAFLLVCGAVVWADLFVAWLYPASYLSAARLVPFLLCAGACSMLSAVAIATTLIANSPRYHLILYTSVFILNVAIGLLLVPRIGAMGAVLTTLATEALVLGFWIVLGKYVLKNLPLAWGVVLVQGAIALAAAALYRPGVLWPAHAIAERIGVSVLFVAVFGAIAVWALRRHRTHLADVLGRRAPGRERANARMTVPASAEEIG
jgi:O-antigen/teichoic acid export membrane protein